MQDRTCLALRANLADQAVFNGHIGYLIQVGGRIDDASVLDDEFAH